MRAATLSRGDQALNSSTMAVEALMEMLSMTKSVSLQNFVLKTLLLWTSWDKVAFIVLAAQESLE